VATLTARFDKALFYSGVLARATSSKINDLDLTARALATAALVIGAGGDEDEVISSLLLELANSQNDARLLPEIRGLFGNEVLAIIEDCLASNYRKIAGTWQYGIYKRILGQHSRSSLVALADSMVMAISLHSQLIAHGSEAWKAYDASREEVLRHFELLARTFGELKPGVLSAHFAALVSELVCAASPYNAEPDPPDGDEPLPFRPRIVSED